MVESAKTMYCKLRVGEHIWLSSQSAHPLSSVKTELGPFDIWVPFALGKVQYSGSNKKKILLNLMRPTGFLGHQMAVAKTAFWWAKCDWIPNIQSKCFLQHTDPPMLLGGQAGEVCCLFPLRGILLYNILSSSQEAFEWREESLCQIERESSMSICSWCWILTVPSWLPLNTWLCTVSPARAEVGRWSPALVLPLNGRRALKQA